MIIKATSNSNSNSNYRTTYLVPRKAVNIHRQCLDINRPVGSISHAVDAHECLVFLRVHRIRDGLDVVYRAEDVARVRQGHKASLVRQEVLEVSHLELRRRCIEAGLRREPPFQDQLLSLGEVDPRGDVCLVVDLGDDDLISVAEVEGLG